jgi:hypothetical protein
MIPYRPFSRFAGRKLPGWKYAEPYRRVYFNQKNRIKNKQPIIVRIFTHFFANIPWTKAKYPKEILIKLKKNNK